MSDPLIGPYSRYARDALVLLGNLIRAGRTSRRMTMEELATRAGISRSLLHRIERGDPRCAIGTVFECAALVGVVLFAEQNQLASVGGKVDTRLALLPRTVRTPQRKVDDDF